MKVREMYHTYKDRLLKINYSSILDYLSGIETICRYFINYLLTKSLARALFDEEEHLEGTSEFLAKS